MPRTSSIVKGGEESGGKGEENEHTLPTVRCENDRTVISDSGGVRIGCDGDRSRIAECITIYM